MKYNALSLFWRRFAVVMSGTAMAQAIPFAAMPILTRLLPPDVLGPYFIWQGVVAILSVFLSLRMDAALFNAQTDKDLQTTLQTAVVMTVFLALLLWVVLEGIKFLSPELTGRLNLNWWGSEAILLGAVWAMSMVVQSAYIYGGHFKRQAAVNVILAIVVALSQILAVVSGWGVVGIIALQIVTTSSILVINLIDINRIYKINLLECVPLRILENLRLNWRFPIFSMPAGFMSSLTGQMPVFLLGNRFGGELGGQYSLMNKSVAAPAKLIAGSVLSIFKEEASRQYREYGECKAIYGTAFKRLAALGVIPFGALYFFSENIFGIIFGENWEQAGEMASMLAPMLYLQFVASPLSYTLYLTGKNIDDLIWQISAAIVISCSLITSVDAVEAVKYLVISYSFLYVINIYMSYRAGCGRAK
jgi:O-antigen/teichoic acid export membrane protein